MNNESIEKLIFTNIHFAVDVKLKTDKRETRGDLPHNKEDLSA
jgi:hypothetical protein